jgi:hypothetical protein
MTALEYLILTGMMPVGVLIMALALVYFLKDKPERPQPGE